LKWHTSGPSKAVDFALNFALRRSCERLGCLA